jgi:partner of Y14 and mago protein
VSRSSFVDTLSTSHLPTSVRKQIKIRPGFTPQEDVSLFRSKRQAQKEATALPKGQVIGWLAPEVAKAQPAAPLTKSAKKNAKRKEKRTEQHAVKENWEDDDEAGNAGGAAVTASREPRPATCDAHTTERPNWALAREGDSKEQVVQTQPTSLAIDEDELSTELAKLDVS